VLVVSPTGSGKTLCFQLPALLRQGVSLVVCPLKTLMSEQVTLAGTFEQYIVGRLMEKLQMASHAIGDAETLLEASGMSERLSIFLHL
jgi:superfamily II DNA helicase RecQ